MKKRAVTISREFGSGGHSIGKIAAKTLGIGFYDQELLEKMYGRTEPSPADTIYFAQAKIIKKLAKKESCIIVGRWDKSRAIVKVDWLMHYISEISPEILIRVVAVQVVLQYGVYYKRADSWVRRPAAPQICPVSRNR